MARTLLDIAHAGNETARFCILFTAIARHSKAEIEHNAASIIHSVLGTLCSAASTMAPAHGLCCHCHAHHNLDKASSARHVRIWEETGSSIKMRLVLL